jgi:DMSO reductase anchor subunit
MNKEKILKSSLFFAIGIAIFASWLKIVHRPGAENLMLLSFLAGAIFIITAIREVTSSQKIDRPEKIMWVLGFLFFTGIAGLIYVFSARKRVV